MSDLFLGLDCSTQALKAVVLDSRLELVTEVRVDFDADLGAKYGVKKGVIVSNEQREDDDDPEPEGVKYGTKEGATVKAPVSMYLEALDLLMERLRKTDLDLARIRCLSGAAQQHSIVLLGNGFDDALLNASASEPLAHQLVPHFASPWVSNWQDFSTSADCRAMTEAIGGEDAMTRLTGSAAHERFSGPQLRKVFGRKRQGVWNKTASVCLLSSFLATLLCGDGSVKPVDEADATGTNLYDITSRDWNDDLLRSVTAGDAKEAQRLRGMLGPVATEPSKPVGRIGRWFVERYGFSADAQVAAFTGDNPATLLSFSLQPGDAIVSMGTSDTVLLATEEYNPHPAYHLMAHPAGDGPGGARRYMAMLCYKNGSLAREFVRDQIKGSDHSWDTFNANVHQHTSGQPEFGFYFPKQEIIPHGVHGVFRRLSSSKPMQVTSPDDLESLELEPIEARRILESQFLSFKSRIQQLLPGESPHVNRIFVTGGASTNETIVGLLANVLNGKVYPSEGGTAQGCASGGAYRAAWTYSGSSSSPESGFTDFVKKARGVTSVVDTVQTTAPITPDPKLAQTYDSLLPGWRAAEDEVRKHCKGL